MYESVVEGIEGNKSLQGQLNEFNMNSIPANEDSLDYEIVLNEAIAIVSKSDTVIPAINVPANVKDIDSINSMHDRILAAKTGVVKDSIIQKSRKNNLQEASDKNEEIKQKLMHKVPSVPQSNQPYAVPSIP